MREPGLEPLLVPWIRAGERCRELPTLDESRARAAAALTELPDELREISPVDGAGANDARYPVEMSGSLRALLEEITTCATR